MIALSFFTRLLFDNMKNIYQKIYSRNIGFVTEAEQEQLNNSTIAIAGTGGIGGLLAERLVRAGVGRLKITDPGTFEESNLNRQYASSMNTIGRDKARTVFEEIKDINPSAEIIHSNRGIRTWEDAENFVEDCHLVIDEMDVGLYRESIFLQRAAKNRNAYYIFSTTIGFGALVAVFAPDGYTLEEYNGLPADIDLDRLSKLEIPIKSFLPILPSYTPQFTETELHDIISGKKPAPTNSIGAGIASVLTANEAINIILKKKPVTVAPKYIYLDLLDQKFIIGDMI
jgi:molybdopterin/thiamine biosynthesis adenylyltransferase